MTNLTTSAWTIALDGDAATGKTTVAKRVAHRLGCTFFDTGKAYRAITWLAKQRELTPLELVEEGEFFREWPLSFRAVEGEFKVFWGERALAKELVSEETSLGVPHYAKQPSVRDFLNQIFRKLDEECRCIWIGRDIASVVFPQAHLKFFLKASSEEKARRRQQQLLKNGVKVSFEKVYQEVKERDRLDREREQAPTLCTQDAIEIDTDRYGIDEVVEKMIQEITKYEQQ